MTATATALAPPLNFIHIPKTAGTALRALVEQHYPADRVAPSSSVKREMERQGLGRREASFTPALAESWLYCGHTNVTSALPPEYRRFTVVREPLARLRSQFGHWQHWSKADIDNSPSSPTVKALKHRAKACTLEEFLAIDAGPVFRLFQNGQCKTLVSNFPVQEHHRLKGPDLAREAITNLDAMLMVGLTERLDDTARLLCYLLAWPPPARVERLNIGRRRRADAPAGNLPEIIRRAIELDAEAYAHAAERFERDHAAMLDDLALPGGDARDVDAEIAALDARSLRALGESGLEPADAIDLRMDAGLRGTGWHELERTRAGHPYRWTGPATRTTLDLLVRPARRLDVRIGVVSLLHRDVLKGAHILINGREPAAQSIDWRLPVGGDPSLHALHARFDESPIGDDAVCRVEIIVPRTHRHEDVEPGCGDTREKGLAVSRVRIERG